MALRPVRLGTEVIDTGLVVYMPGPNSFTGEDTAELQVHGSPAVVRALLRGLAAIEGVRLAEAGEFTRRAFINGKLDLTEVEGLGDLIAAETETQRQQAAARLAGGVATDIARWRESLLDARAEIEAQLDFSDEGDVPDGLPPRVLLEMTQLRAEIGTALEGVARGRIVREGLRVALAGPPNVGKSSLLNALARSDVAIVSDEAGTTRDIKEVALDLGGRLVILVDMAGLRETSSQAEAEGVRRANREIAAADLVLWLSAPDVAGLPPPDAPELWSVATKADLKRGEAQFVISVQTGDGLAGLLAALARFAEDAAGNTTSLLSRERDRQALQDADSALGRFVTRGQGDELAAEDLRAATTALERLIGRVDSEQVLDRLFAGFCIGK